jgi:hypothetical protein
MLPHQALNPVMRTSPMFLAATQLRVHRFPFRHANLHDCSCCAAEYRTNSWVLTTGSAATCGYLNGNPLYLP